MIINCLIGFLSGFIGALGLGGGGVLVMFLTVFMGIGQLKAQGINLLFFIPVGIFAIIFHCRRKLISWRIALPAIIAGLIGATIGCFLASFLGAAVLRKIFGAMLLLFGSWELFAPHKKHDEKTKKAK